jgi:RNA recognition motif-containing protein
VSLFISNLNFKTTENQIVDFFLDNFEESLSKDEVIKCALIKDRDQRSKGYAYLHVSSQQVVNRLIASFSVI